MSSEVKQTQQHILRAMVMNYAEGHAWDRLDSEACAKAADEIATLEAECERLREQVKALQSDANSWQSGYDKGREDGAKAADRWRAQHARDSAELRRLCSERDALAAELAAIKMREPVAWIVPDFGFLFPTEDAAQRYLRNINDLRKPTALYSLPPATEQSQNQCDGCQAGIPLVNGTHRMGRTGGYPDLMGCTAHLYKPSAEGEVVAALDRNAAFKACPDTGCDWSSFYRGWKSAIKAFRAEQQKGEK